MTSKTKEVVATPDFIKEHWPLAKKQWRVDLYGVPPGEGDVQFALTYGKPGTRVAFAWAMYARGAADHKTMHADATNAACHVIDSSGTQRVKLERALRLGHIVGLDANGKRLKAGDDAVKFACCVTDAATLKSLKAKPITIEPVKDEPTVNETPEA